MTNFLLVGFGGFLGAISRYGIGRIVGQYVPNPFPIATLLINFLGCLSIGYLHEAFKNHELFPWISVFASIGFLGAFTTFSAFSFETLELIKRGQIPYASLNVVGTVILCLAGVVVGERLGKITGSLPF